MYPMQESKAVSPMLGEWRKSRRLLKQLLHMLRGTNLQKTSTEDDVPQAINRLVSMESLK